jgi:ElaB/YqjD/DUF883 family membrane-anchored ribosome-binding protein
MRRLMSAPLTNSDPQPGASDPFETTSKFGEQILGRTAQAATATVDTIKEHPIATLAIVAGVAFAVSALWRLRSSRPE